MASKKKKPIPDDLLLQVFKEIFTVQGHPRLIVLVGNGFLEVLVNILVREKLKNGLKIQNDSRTYTYAVRLLMLHEAGIITDKEFRMLDWYRDIRNRAAHEPIFNVTIDDFKALNNSNYTTPDSLFDLTTVLMGAIWNKHHKLFSPLFGVIPKKP